MFESIFYTSGAMPLEASGTMLSLICGIALGFVISIAYNLSTEKRARSQKFAMSLVVLPVIVAVIILLIGGNIARAFSLAGVFTLIRYRSLPGDSKDITFVFLAMAVGLTLGMGYLSLGVVITVMLGLVITVFSLLGDKKKSMEKKLSIQIPEDMNNSDVFNDIFEKYTSQSTLQRIRTRNLGTLYELTYYIVLKNEGTEKQFIDELRTRNGNLNISINAKEDKESL